MKQLLFVIILINTAFPVIAQIEENYKYSNNRTYTYEETHEVYQQLADKYENAQLYTIGESDAGKPIKLFVISEDKDFNLEVFNKNDKGVLLINNAIHPGEPCGVDASIKLAYDLLSKDKYKELLENTNVCIIPFYNVGGGLNRSCCSRANQNGPEEYGFRGNAQNRDLNRDFIKCDTKNSEAFIKIYHICDPDIFIDTHATNGADFQYAMSIIATQPDKINIYLKDYLRNKMLPFLYEDMEKKKKEIVPYVYNYKKSPDQGIKDYMDSPRYSTGYTTLFNTIGFVTEALKYKSYQERVEHTYEFLLTSLNWMNKNHNELKQVRKDAIEDVINQRDFDLAWELDTNTFKKIDFKGYEVENNKSDFGEDATYLVYNHNKKFTKKIHYYYKYKATSTINKPIAYIVPQAYKGVVDRLKWNNIEMMQLKNDTVVNAEMYYIKNYETVKTPYEGHYLHYGVELDKKIMDVKYYSGDYIIYVNQSTNRYIVETLEPQGMDSFFAWNFFDGILQQKEWFSPFSFEKSATELLVSDNVLKNEFEQKKKEDIEFAKSRDQQLYFLYKRSPYYEVTHNRYPVARLIQ